MNKVLSDKARNSESQRIDTSSLIFNLCILSSATAAWSTLCQGRLNSYLHLYIYIYIYIYICIYIYIFFFFTGYRHFLHFGLILIWLACVYCIHCKMERAKLTPKAKLAPISRGPVWPIKVRFGLFEPKRVGQVPFRPLQNLNWPL